MCVNLRLRGSDEENLVLVRCSKGEKALLCIVRSITITRKRYSYLGDGPVHL